MPLVVKDRIRETTTATLFGTGNPTLAGAVSGFRSFADIGNGNTTYYTIVGGTQWEVGIGTYTAAGTTLSRDTVLSNSLGTTAKIDFTAGIKDVFVTSPSALALLGRGGSFLPSNLAIGSSSIDSNLITASNTDLIAIGNNTLPLVGKGVATLNLLSGGDGYFDGEGSDNFTASGQCVYLSGTPVTAGGTYPQVAVSVLGGVIQSPVLVTDTGSGFPTTVTDARFTIELIGDHSVITPAECNPLTFSSGSNLIAIGNNTGSTSKVNSNSIYIGNNVTGINSNEIKIGNSSNLTTSISGTLTTGGISCGASTIGTTGNVVIGHNGTNALTNAITIGSTAGRGTITLGQSTNSTQVVSISSGAVTTGAKTLNISNGATGGTTVVNMANISGSSLISICNGTGTKTINLGTGTSGNNTAIDIGSTSGPNTVTLSSTTFNQTVNIATGASTANVTKTLNIGTGASVSTAVTNITIGATLGTSTTTVQGYFKPPALASAPAYVKGAVYFNTTDSKLYVGGATTWEQITSI
jgi:hypothetical protein